MINFGTILDYYWVVPLVGVGLVAYKFLGWRGLIAVATLGAAGGLYTKGRTDQRKETERAAQAARSRAIEQRAQVDAEVSAMDPDTKRNRLDKWMRKP